MGDVVTRILADASMREKHAIESLMQNRAGQEAPWFDSKAS